MCSYAHCCVLVVCLPAFKYTRVNLQLHLLLPFLGHANLPASVNAVTFPKPPLAWETPKFVTVIKCATCLATAALT